MARWDDGENDIACAEEGSVGVVGGDASAFYARGGRGGATGCAGEYGVGVREEEAGYAETHVAYGKDADCWLGRWRE